MRVDRSDIEDFATSPLLAGAVLLAAGILIRGWQPTVLELPSPDNDYDPGDTGIARAARKSRDGLAALLPRNLTKSIARSLVIVGAGLIVVRGLDALVEEDEALY